MGEADLSGAIAAEQRLLDPAVRSDPTALSQLLDEDFTEIGQTGMLWSRSAVIEAMVAEPGDRTGEASGWTVRQVGDGLAIVTYETVHSTTRVRRTTLWRRRGGVWRAVAHQGTRVVD